MAHRTFIIKEDGEGQKELHEFLEENGKIISVTAGYIATATGARQTGRWLVAADNGKEPTVKL